MLFLQLSLALLGVRANSAPAASSSMFFVGSCGGDVPLVSLSESTDTNVLAVNVENLGEFNLGSAASWNVGHPTKPGVLYSSGGPAAITALKYSIDGSKATGAVMSNMSVPAAPVHMSMSHTNSHLLVVGYVAGTVSAVEISGTDASLTKITSISQHNGTSKCDPSTPAGGRQTSPHPHSIVPGPAGSSYHYSPDLGLDKVFQYSLDDKTGALTIVDELDVAECSGPRHMAFHPNGQYAYLLHEMASSISLHAVGGTDGKLSKALYTLPLVTDPGWHYCSEPVPFPINGAGNCTKAAEVRITPDGKYIFASNRGHNSIVKLSLSNSGGSFIGGVDVVAWVTWVRGMDVSPDGKYLVVASDSRSDMEVNDARTVVQGGGSQPQPMGGKVIVYAIDLEGKGVLTRAATLPVPTGCDISFV